MQPCNKISPFSSDANGDAASPSSSDYTEADSDRKGDLATEPRGLCVSLCSIHANFVMELTELFSAIQRLAKIYTHM